MNIELDNMDFQRLKELAKREGKTVEDLAAEIFQDGLKVREQNGTWVDEVSGSFENDPEFEEVVKLGRQLREGQGPDLEE